ncbi:DinB family protein [Chitinophaga sp. GCM10012297]|uniref:DinB family protein n=1 Tax=Chitinophaga chungangae TaxID=2821488 RepID=A0ABS3YDX2_9BACT|nr:DinB family protein [Chitinophaga chungangae]MBO9152665.1 DinB family protein [Chitinophaga chungangae]
MPVFQAAALLQNLRNDVKGLLSAFNTQIVTQSNAVLLQQPAPGSWSAAQCLDHLNGYGNFYLPALEQAINKAVHNQWNATPEFRSGWLGNYFTNLMQPKPDGALKSKMNAPKGHRPAPQLDAPAILAEFISQQEKMLALLQRAEKVNITRMRVPTSLSSLLKLNAGDTFRFLIAHQQRHMLQALRAVHSASGGNQTAVTMQYLEEQVR